MLEQFFRAATVVERHRRAPIVGLYLDDITDRLSQLGYKEATVRGYIYACEDFGRFLAQSHIDLRDVDEAQVDRFFKAVAGRRRRREVAVNTRRPAGGRRPALAFLLEWLREVGIVATPSLSASVAPQPEVLHEYLAFLRNHRGLQEPTIQQHGLHVGRFLRHIGSGADAIEALTVQQIDRFLIDCGRWLSRRSICRVSAALRGFLRYLHLCARSSRDLSPMVTVPRVYKLETVPRGLSWPDVGKLLDSPDRTSVAGRRDYAILMLLVVYGLRAGEVATLRLDDLDWKGCWLRIRHAKNDNSSLYPLDPEVGEALVDYLRRGRPTSPLRQVFLTLYAPIRPFSRSSAISNVVARHLRRAGIDAPHWGAHTLRHSHALRLLQQGMSLKAIGDSLGHRNPESTFIYTKAAVDDLHCVALDITEVLS